MSPISVHTQAVVQQSEQSARLFESEYGYFDAQAREYVITDVRTPRPWINVMANESYGLVLSQAGGGFSWYENCQLNRITRWEQDLVTDSYGRWLYIANLYEGTVASSTPNPVSQTPLISESVRHGLGYSVFEREFVGGLSTEHTVFVSPTDPCEVWIVRLFNSGGRALHLRLATYLDLHLGGAGDAHREFHRLFLETRVEGQSCLAWKHPALPEHERTVRDPGYVAFHSGTFANPRWILDKRRFFGERGSPQRPESLFDSTDSPSGGRWDDPILSLQGDLTLQSGQEVALAFVIGAAQDAQACRNLAAAYDLPRAESELERTRAHWQTVLGETRVETPDEALNLMTNDWFRYQTIACRLMARCAYYQQGGAYGYRDQLQDSLMLLTSDPEATRLQLVRHAEAMYDDGGVRHWWHPNTSFFAESRHSDTCLWLAHGTLAYLDETNNLDALHIDCRYLDRGAQTVRGHGSLLDHCLRGIDRCLDRLTARGLPRIEAGDWNDGLSHAGLDGKGESVWLAMFLYDILRRFAPILEQCISKDVSLRYAAAAAGLRTAVEEHGWDGEWYLAGTRDDGRPLGSRDEAEGQIFLNTQTWAAISGIGSRERTQRALQSARERLVKPYGTLLLAPAFSKVDPFVGYITRYAPGLRENGGVYSHASVWAIIAYAMMGEIDLAYEIYRGMNPALKFSDSARYAAEPYVMPGNVDGPDSPNEGCGGWTWYTGSSAWMVRAAIDWLCGVRATREGLLVNPEPPSEWEGYSLSREFRGRIWDIEVTGRGKPVSKKLDGVSWGGSVLPDGGGARRRLEIELAED